MSDGPGELKPLLLEVLKTVNAIRDDHEKRFDRIENRLDQMDGRLNQMDGRLDQMDGRLDQMDGRLNQVDGRLDKVDGRIAELVSETKQVKELLGAVRLKEIGRLDGRIDQLTLEVTLGRRGAA